jgi:catechol 2,3-dioxygenase
MALSPCAAALPFPPDQEIPMTSLAASARAPGADRPNLYAAETPVRIGKVTLVVRNLPLVAGFYEKVIGLAPLASGPGRVTLGAGGKPLLELIENKEAAPSSPRAAGLFHIAFLVPTRKDLARWLLHVAGIGARIQGASDHVVSEAIYLADPEGNGIEVYHDRAPQSWTWQGDTVAMATDHLDLDGLVSGVEPGDWQGLPEGSCVGHVHLRVGDIPAADAFYKDALGLGLTARYPGGSFFSSGRYHHHIAANVWSSRGAGPRPLPTTGLAEVELVARDEAAWQDLSDRVSAKGGAQRADGSLAVEDPWRNVLVIRKG